MTPSRAVPVELDDAHSDVRIGVIVPFDFAIDREYWCFAPADVTLHITRTPYTDLPLGMALVEAVSDIQVIRDSVRDLIAPDPVLMVYACTSGSFIRGLDGEREIRQAMLAAGARQAMTTSGALLEALAALEVERLAVGTPYDEHVTAKLGEFLREADVEVVSVAYLGLSGDVDRVGGTSLARLAEEADDEGADALFLSCTNLPTFDAVAGLERDLGKPVLSANQVTMWAALRAVGRLPALDQQLFARSSTDRRASLLID